MSKQFLKLILLTFFFIPSLSIGQNAISASVHQDFKLLLFGDDRGNRAGTLDILTRIKYSGKERKSGYFTYFVEFEKAEIENNYYRYGAGFGYTFSNIFSDKNIEFSASAGIGNIHRRDEDSLSYSATASLNFIMSPRIKLGSMFQYINRTDLDRNLVRYSFFIGLEVRLFKLKS